MTAGWGMTYYRTCVWGRFQHITTGQTVCIMNTHYETPGNDEAQENGSNIIVERMATVCDSSDSLIVLMGDFNALKSYPAMTLLFENNLSDPSTDPTYCGDMISATCTQKFDFTLYRLLNDDVCHVSTEVSRVSYDGCYPSDHAGLVASFCLSGSCCSSNSTSSSGSVELDDNSASSTISSVSGEEDIVGTVKSATADTVGTDGSSASGDGSSQQISTKSEESSSASTTVGIIFGVLGAVAVVALVVVRRKKILEKRAMDDKDTSLRPVPGYFTRADSETQALSPLRAGSESSSISESPIPELAAVAKDARDSRSSSVSVSDSEKAMLEARRSSGVASHAFSRRSSSAVIMGPSDFSESRFSQSFASSSMAESQIHFSEMFAPESCTSDDGGPLSKTKTDFAML